MKNKLTDSLTIQQYLEGTLDSRTMHQLEKQALEDEFLSDALEGFTYVIEPAEKLSILQQRLADRILVQQANKKAFSITSHRLSIAAASGLMCVLAAILFWLNGYQKPEVNKTVDVNLSSQYTKQSAAAEITSKTTSIATSVASPIFALAEHSLSRSEPVTGWVEYSKYIQDNITLDKKAFLPNDVKKIMIVFKISKAGTPVDFKVADGISDKYSKEIIRVIKNGPLWKSLDNEEVKVQINFNK